MEKTKIIHTFWTYQHGGGGTEARLRKRVLSCYGYYMGEGGSQGSHQGSMRPPARPDPRPRQVAARVPGGGPLAPPR